MYQIILEFPFIASVISINLLTHQTFHSTSFLLSKDGSLTFQQVPVIEIDRMKLVQTRAVLNYIATKYHLCGKDIKERAMIDMFTEGIMYLCEMIMLCPVSCPLAEKDDKMALIKERARNHYLPVYEKVSGLFSVLGTEMRNA
uniref:glutathione transferase n=1 Tax=Catagonus wagneri TaxID=51154 RepID=A0A8C3X790_9CETA